MWWWWGIIFDILGQALFIAVTVSLFCNEEQVQNDVAMYFYSLLLYEKILLSIRKMGSIFFFNCLYLLPDNLKKPLMIWSHPFLCLFVRILF